MKYESSLLVCKDPIKSKEFYQRVTGAKIVMDLGVHVVFDHGFALQEEKSWLELLGGKVPSPLAYRGNVSELYFEIDDLDAFLKDIEPLQIEFVHNVLEMEWGQRVVRFYDPDGHILEVGENMKVVTKRYLKSGMSLEQVQEKVLFPMPFVLMCQEELKNEA